MQGRLSIGQGLRQDLERLDRDARLERLVKPAPPGGDEEIINAAITEMRS
jgi:hypothetical protein